MLVGTCHCFVPSSPFASHNFLMVDQFLWFSVFKVAFYWNNRRHLVRPHNRARKQYNTLLDWCLNVISASWTFNRFPGGQATEQVSERRFYCASSGIPTREKPQLKSSQKSKFSNKSYVRVCEFQMSGIKTVSCKIQPAPKDRCESNQWMDRDEQPTPGQRQRGW